MKQVGVEQCEDVLTSPDLATKAIAESDRGARAIARLRESAELCDPVRESLGVEGDRLGLGPPGPRFAVVVVWAKLQNFLRSLVVRFERLPWKRPAAMRDPRQLLEIHRFEWAARSPPMAGGSAEVAQPIRVKIADVHDGRVRLVVTAADDVPVVLLPQCGDSARELDCESMLIADGLAMSP